MFGKLYGVGVGPGDPELLTLKAVRIINECDYIAIPCDKKEQCLSYAIALQAIPNLANKPIIPINIPMIKDEVISKQNYQNASQNLISYLEQGLTIAFLTIGDPTIYSTYLYIHEIIMANHFECEIISGITSFCAAAATLNEGLVKKDEPLHLIPASYPVEEVLDLPGTKIFMKSGKQLPSIKSALLAKNLSSKMITNCGLENEAIYQRVEDFPEESSYYTLIITT